MKESTDRVIHRVAILGILAIATFTGYRLTHLPLRASSARSRYAVGDTLALRNGVVGIGKHTILIFGRSTCGACRTAKPVMKQIADAVNKRTDGVRMRFMAVQGRRESELRMADELGIRREDVIAADDGIEQTKIRVVPTFIVVDAKERVEFVSEGAPADVKRLLSVLDKTEG